MRTLLIMIFCLLLCLSTAHGRDSQEYEFTKDYIESLKNADAAAQIAGAVKGGDTVVLTGELRSANKKIGLAKDCIQRCQDSKNANIKAAAEYLLKSYDTQISANDKRIEFHRTMNSPEVIADPSKFDQKKAKEEIGDIAVENARAWKMLSDCTTMIFLSVLVDPVRKEGEKTNRLTITKKERNDLIAQIDETFGKEIARGPQKNRTVAYNCAALIRAGLKKPYGVSD